METEEPLRKCSISYDAGDGQLGCCSEFRAGNTGKRVKEYAMDDFEKAVQG